MSIMSFDLEKCSGCSVCASVCPCNCIEMVENTEGFIIPSVKSDKCIGCGECEQRCPILNDLNQDVLEESQALVAQSLDQTIRTSSSSGGIFSILAKEIINCGGVVCGAMFNDDYSYVYHGFISDISDIGKIRGSKYIQSIIGNSYIMTKKFLDAGKKVLFTGTPCQIGGLYSYLGRQYDNLYTQDVVCHGVPSPKLWKKYIREREQVAGASTRYVSFRNKKYGWKSFSMSIEFDDKSTYSKTLREDPYIRLFLSNACLRLSCYNCSFKKKTRQSDITLADFWGCQYVIPSMDDNKGTSLIILNSSRGKELIEKVSSEVITEHIDMQVAIRYNPALVNSVPINAQRNLVFDMISDKTIEDIARVIAPLSIKSRFTNLLSKIGIYDILVSIKACLSRKMGG